MEFVAQKYEEIREKLDKMEFERKEHLVYIKSLEDKIESFERNQRLCSVELRNVPQKKAESKHDLCKMITNIGSCLNITIETTEIRDVFRTSTRGTAHIWLSNYHQIIWFIHYY